MKLKDYLRPMTEQQRLNFAMACETSLQYLKFVAYGAKKASPVLAMSIEKESGGAVRAEEIRPDLAEKWAYMRSTTPSESEASGETQKAEAA